MGSLLIVQQSFTHTYSNLPIVCFQEKATTSYKHIIIIKFFYFNTIEGENMIQAFTMLSTKTLFTTIPTINVAATIIIDSIILIVSKIMKEERGGRRLYK